MKKIIILIPIFNDWKSLIKLIDEINNIVKNIKDYEFSCIIINDASSIQQPKITKPSNINSVQIINMKKNRGHARCNAFGIRHVIKEEIFDYLILMDGDGEDRPIEIKDLVNEISKNRNTSVVAKRIKRSEGPLFQLMYQIHKLVTLIFTGKKMNFGNYSCLTNNDVKTLSDKPSLWSSYSGSVKKNLIKLNEINSTRGMRYFGPSQMSLHNLAIHSFSIIAVFKYQVFLRSSFIIIILSYLNNFFGIYSVILQILVVIFNLLIFVVSLREKKKDLNDCHLNVHEKIDIID